MKWFDNFIASTTADLFNVTANGRFEGHDSNNNPTTSTNTIDASNFAFDVADIASDQLADKTMLHLAVALNLVKLVKSFLYLHLRHTIITNTLLLSEQSLDITSHRNPSRKCLLLLRQVDPMALDRAQNTPLTWAVALGHADLVRLLLRCDGSTTDEMDHHHHAINSRQTLVDIAIERGHHIVSRLIEEEEKMKASPKIEEKEKKLTSEFNQVTDKCSSLLFLLPSQSDNYNYSNRSNKNNENNNINNNNNNKEGNLSSYDDNDIMNTKTTKQTTATASFLVSS